MIKYTVTVTFTTDIYVKNAAELRKYIHARLINKMEGVTEVTTEILTRKHLRAGKRLPAVRDNAKRR